MGKAISIRIDGDTNVKKRQDQIESFQTGEQKRVALLSLDAASVGFSLTASSTVFFAELSWTPSGLMQAEDRCHRMGQRSKVTCHYFIAKGSLDEAMLKLVQDKYIDLRQFVSTKDETMEMKDYSIPELQSEQSRTSIHQDEAREINAPIAEAEGKVCCQAVTDSSDQLGKRPSAAQSRLTQKKTAKRTCFSRNCNNMARKSSFCNKHVCEKQKYTCSYGDCTFLVANVDSSRCQNHVGY